MKNGVIWYLHNFTILVFIDRTCVILRLPNWKIHSCFSRYSQTGIQDSVTHIVEEWIPRIVKELKHDFFI